MGTSSNRRIVKNTMLLYVRMLLVMGVSLYTSRVILQALGFDGYGLYNVIGGFVGLFGIISGSLSGAISRFITFELGKENSNQLKKVFSSANIIQLALCGIIILLSLTVGVWFIANKMKIPNGDYVSAYWVFGLSIASFCISLMSVPYNAAIIAHEKMGVFSYVSILEVALKLGVAYSISLFSSNRLILYAFLLFIISATIRLIYTVYCRRNFEECSSGIECDMNVVKEIGKFAGWNFIGAASGILKNQGTNVILNLFYGTVVNAAYAICMQVNSAASQLSTNFMTAVNPQITKLYASGNVDEMNVLIMRSSKISFFLNWIISIIIFINTPMILNIWLSNVPEYTATFVHFILILLLSESISIPLITAMLATGDIRKYQIVVGGLQLLNLPLSYMALKMGYAAPCVLVIAIVISQMCFVSRLFLLKGMIGLKISSFLRSVYFRCLLVASLSYLMTIFFVHLLGDETFGIFVVESIVCFAMSVVLIYWIGFERSERLYIRGMIVALKHKLHSND